LPGWSQNPSFTLSWTQGRCIECRTASELGHIEFIGRTAAWAVGYNSGTRGPGNAIVVHTEDGGRTWREIPESAQDNGTPAGPPAFWFRNADRGWLSASLAGEDPLTVTTFDAGGHWLDLRPVQLREMRFFDEARGFATLDDSVLRTRDGGLNWSEYVLARVRAVDRMFFLSPDEGWAAGTDGASVTVARTTDAGRIWQSSRTSLPSRPETVQDLFFLDEMKGWILVWNENGKGTTALATVDGGKTWATMREPGFQGPGRWATTVRFLSPRDGFVFEESDNGERALFSTADGGARWTRQSLPTAVRDCQTVEEDLLCSAGEEPDGFSILTLHRAPVR
jgi:photosystem II stability/assembly factor-like uncharacterized protein